MNFVVALSTEAMPVVEAFGLKKYSGKTPFPIFINDLHTLVISGVGKNRAASATGYLLGRNQSTSPVFLNFGIAGHGSMPLGSAFLATRIISDQESENYYPPQIISTRIRKSPLCSVSQPVTDYPEEIGYDMEAHAFFATACLGTTRELIQVFKVVSDNPNHSIAEIDGDQITQLIAGSLPDFQTICGQLQSMEKEINPKSEEIEFKTLGYSIHPFSQTQRHLLDRLFRHAHSLSLDQSIILAELRSGKSAKEAIRNLEKILEPHRVIK